MKSLRKAYWFVQAYLCMLSTHRVLQAGGFKLARRRFLKPWNPGEQPLSLSDPARISEISAAVQEACRWQWRQSECLHTAIVTYHLLRKIGAQPRFIMATSSQPFVSHAWVELDGRVVADDDTDWRRSQFTPLLCIP